MRRSLSYFNNRSPNCSYSTEQGKVTVRRARGTDSEASKVFDAVSGFVNESSFDTVNKLSRIFGDSYETQLPYLSSLCDLGAAYVDGDFHFNVNIQHETVEAEKTRVIDACQLAAIRGFIDLAWQLEQEEDNCMNFTIDVDDDDVSEDYNFQIVQCVGRHSYEVHNYNGHPVEMDATTIININGVESKLLIHFPVKSPDITLPSIVCNIATPDELMALIDDFTSCNLEDTTLLEEFRKFDVVIEINMNENIYDFEGHEIATMSQLFNSIRNSINTNGFLKTAADYVCGKNTNLSDFKSYLTTKWDVTSSTISTYWDQLCDIIPQGPYAFVRWIKNIASTYSTVSYDQTTIKFANRDSYTTKSILSYAISGIATSVAQIVGSILTMAAGTVGKIVGGALYLGASAVSALTQTVTDKTYVSVNQAADDLDFGYPVFQMTIGQGTDFPLYINGKRNSLLDFMSQNEGITKLVYPGFDVYAWWTSTEHVAINIEVKLSTAYHTYDKMATDFTSSGNCIVRKDYQRSDVWWSHETPFIKLSQDGMFDLINPKTIASWYDDPDTAHDFESYSDYDTNLAAEYFARSYGAFCSFMTLVWMDNLCVAGATDGEYVLDTDNAPLVYGVEKTLPSGAIEVNFYDHSVLSGLEVMKRCTEDVATSLNVSSLYGSWDGIFDKGDLTYDLPWCSGIAEYENKLTPMFNVPGVTSYSELNKFVFPIVMYSLLTGYSTFSYYNRTYHGNEVIYNTITSVVDNIREPINIMNKSANYLTPPKFTKKSILTTAVKTLVIAAAVAITVVTAYAVTRKPINQKRANNIMECQRNWQAMESATTQEEFQAAYKSYKKSVFKNNMWRLVIGGNKISKYDYYAGDISGGGMSMSDTMDSATSALENINVAEEEIPTEYNSGMSSMGVSFTPSINDVYQAITGKIFTPVQSDDDNQNTRVSNSFVPLWTDLYND